VLCSSSFECHPRAPLGAYKTHPICDSKLLTYLTAPLKKKSGAGKTNLQQKIYAGSTYTKNTKLEFPINTISQRTRSYTNSLKRISVPIRVLHPANSLVITICFQTATYVPVSLSNHAYCSYTVRLGHMTSAMYCTSFSEYHQTFITLSTVKQKSFWHREIPTFNCTWQIRKVNKRAICFTHNSYTPTIPRLSKRDFPRRSLLCN
jgi:hypothetical protein